MFNYFAIGTILGLSAGLAPGPLLTLVISETLQHDTRAGIKVALAPVITDFPIIVLTLLILSKLSGFHSILGAISLTGGVFIIYMGYKCIRTKGIRPDLREAKSGSLGRGILANVLSPHPYLFWFSVGAPTMTSALSLNISAPLAFIVSFYLFLVGSKILLAVLVGRSKAFLSGTAYIYTMRLLGLALGALACVLFYDGLKLFGVEFF